MGNSGGGAIAGMFCTAQIENSTFAYNTADMYGGAISNFASSADILNTTFYGNHAGFSGGVIENPKGDQAGQGVATLTHTTLVGNTSGSEANAIKNLGTLTLTNSIVAGNSGANACDGTGTLNDGGGNIRWPRKDASCPGTAANPLLAPLGSYGGSTQTLALLPGSMAIDAGEEAACAATDQRGVTRPQGDRCDSGAFESRGFILTVQNGDYQGVKVGNTFPRPLDMWVLSRFSEPVDGGLARFVASESGASLDPRVTVTTIEDGSARIKARANNVAGLHTVKGLVRGGNNAAEFHLGNIE